MTEQTKPVAFFDPQERGFYWAKPTKIDVPVSIYVEPIPLYAEPHPLKSQPAKPDPRDEVIRLAKTVLDEIDYEIRAGGYADGFTEIWKRLDAAITAIDSLPKKGVE